MESITSKAQASRARMTSSWKNGELHQRWGGQVEVAGDGLDYGNSSEEDRGGRGEGKTQRIARTCSVGRERERWRIWARG